jgi:hypothetical protein
VAVVHLADADYFKDLNRQLRSYDAVFYEMVGGPYTPEKAPQSRSATSSDPNLAQIQGIQQMAKNILRLEFQLDGLDYSRPNFIHADMSADEFARQSEQGQDLSNMLARALKVAQSGNIKGMPTTEAEANQMMSMLFGAMLSGDSNELKRTLAPILSESEAFMSQLEGDEGTVLISRRNQIVIDKVRETVAGRTVPGPKYDAILYGAGHMPDLEARLIDLGYRKTNTLWTHAWSIGKGVPSNEAAPGLPNLGGILGDLMRMLEEQQ